MRTLARVFTDVGSVLVQDEQNPFFLLSLFEHNETLTVKRIEPDS